MAAVGYQFGVSGETYSHVSLVLAFTFSAVILLIADLDRAREGLFGLNLQPMIELHQKLGTPGL